MTGIWCWLWARGSAGAAGRRCQYRFIWASLKLLGLPHSIAAVFHESMFQPTGKESCQYLKTYAWQWHSVTSDILLVKAVTKLAQIWVPVEEEEEDRRNYI